MRRGLGVGGVHQGICVRIWKEIVLNQGPPRKGLSISRNTEMEAVSHAAV